MKKGKPNIKADFSGYERRPTWSVVTSRELSKILGVSLNTICNWRLRNILPEPESNPRLKGNKAHYRISKIRSWLEDRPEDEIHWDWIENHFNLGESFTSLKQAEEMVNLCWDIYGIEKPLIPGNFADAG